MIILTVLALLVVLQALLGAISVLARLFWGILGLTLLYLLLGQLSGR